MPDVIITSGGTEEPIDSVRSITNFSTGSTGAFLARYFYQIGCHVELWKSERAMNPEEDVHIREFLTYEDLSQLMRRELPMRTKPFLFIHAAAVSDYSVEKITDHSGQSFPQTNTQKISSQNPLMVHLKPNPKLLNSIKSLNPLAQVIGFKLTVGPPEPHIQDWIETQLSQGTVDAVVHNNLNKIKNNVHPHQIYTHESPPLSGKTKSDMAQNIAQLFLRSSS